MASVENRVVKIEFDNGSFEKNVSTTLSTISKLNEAIANIGTKGGLKELSEATKTFSMDSMTSAIEGVSAKFLALSTIGITALANLTNKAIDAGITIAKSLTFDQIAAGFNEYELKLGSIQTIMAGSGESLDTVNKKLQELNTYSDKTIYSFADMTTNIGKFTNAGVDLDTAVASIQGVANVAAVSGANAEEAGRAMYNFAQALSKGHVQLLDWKSIELANMGTVEFKQQLIDAAAATGTLTKQGENWVTAQGTMVSATKGFNESLTDQWLTTEVLTGTLSDYSDETTAIGAKATAAAQDVKTFTQLMSTVKESIGSGWAQSFEILIGNFDEAKALFTDINNAISGYVGRSADARNELLQGWKDMGGRTRLIEGLQAAFGNLADVINPIKKAFRDIFPAMTAERLYGITDAFASFMENLKPSEGTINNIKSIFKGFFSVIEIGWEVIKGAIGLVLDLVAEITGLGSGAALDGMSKVGDFFSELNEKLVDGGGIVGFFTKIKDAISEVIPFIIEIKDTIVEFVQGLDFSSVKNFFDSIGEALGGVSFDTGVFDPFIDRWQQLGEWMGKAGDALSTFGGIVSDVWGSITGFFSDLASKIGEAIDGGDFDAVTDALSVGLLGALAAMFAKFLKGGINIDFGGGFLEGITDSLHQLTGVLSAMETKLKAEALQKIAIAIAILTASVVILSLIDSDDLAKAMTALTVGFGQLMAALALLNKLEFGPKDTLKLALISIALTMLAGAILVLTVAAKIMSTLDWDELARGLTGTAALLLMLSGVALILSKNSGSMVRAGVGILAMAVALAVLAISMKLFAGMNWAEMGKGFAGVTGGLAALAVAMKLMPSDMASRTAGLLGVAVALNLIALSMKIFATMSWGELVKGFAGVAGGLLLMAGAMRLMPKNMKMQAFSILILSGAMIILAKAMKEFGELSWTEIAKGIITIAGTLLILGIAMKAMSGSLVGSAALLLITFALDKLAGVVRTFAEIPLGILLKGILGIAIVLGVLAAAAYLMAPAIPAMLALGAALIVIAAGFALFGVAAALVAGAFATMAKVGSVGAEALVVALQSVGKAIPALATGLALGLIELIRILGESAPIIVEAIMKLLGALLDAIVDLIPKVADVLGTLITAMIDIIKEKVPEFVDAGLEMLVGILTGIRDNIDDVVLVVSEIITGFLDALTEAVPEVITSVANLIIAIFTGAAEAVGRVAATLMFGLGIAFITGFRDGINDQVPVVKRFFTGLPLDIILWIGDVAKTIWNKGKELIGGLVGGIVAKAVAVTNWFGSLPGEVIKWLGDVASTLWAKGTDFIQGLLNGINNKIGEISSFFLGLARKVKTWVGNLASTLWGTGSALITGLFEGIKFGYTRVTTWLGDLGGRIKRAIGKIGDILYDIGKEIFDGLLRGMTAAWDSMTGWIGGIGGKIADLKGPPATDKVLLVENGMLIFQGLQTGMETEWENVATWLSRINPADEMDKDMGANMAKLLNDSMIGVDINPKITPVLDLTQIEKDAKTIEKLLPINSTMQAGIIAGYNTGQATVTDNTTPTPEINFNQTINAPKQLSTVDIYRQTRNQIALAKEELRIP